MIEMIKGIYGLKVGNTVRPMSKRSGPFSLSKKRERQLVASGFAKYVKEEVVEQEELKENIRAPEETD